MQRRAVRLATGLVAAVCVAASLAACGGSDDGSSDSPGAPGASVPTGTPIRVGFFNPSTGPLASPGVGTGSKAAVKYINSDLGGVNGHPIEVIDCAVDGTPETSISCANKFVSERVVAALDGYNLTSSATLPILTPAGIPLVGMIPFDSVTGSEATNRVYFGAPQAAYLIGALQAFQQQGKKSAVLVLADTPSSHQTIDMVLKPIGAALGIDVTGLYYSPTNPNFTALASSIVSSDPDVGGLIASPNDATCTRLLQNMRQLGYQGTVLLAACTGFIKQAPAQAANSAIYSSTWLPTASTHAPANSQEELKIASKYIDAENGTADYYAYGTFSLFADFAKGLATAPAAELTGQGILATLKGLTAFPGFLGPELTCGKATSPNCTTQILLFEVQPDGTTKPVTGTFLTALPDILARIPGAS
ncbi:ABC transporter substrate-binding protein [Frankia sp. CNm7]|uniref:ABC transporter substrate-binding protein n=1 Tax=Frankia nepalensis TaxID=1836974 RepID=A0A937RE55_9ACTN|nr:ABC transporter substrate-binding protein [Frankia nepalensis]MBL7499256.1 ABC transporter substrate-binding protein [Frankia nepalensis]MBL7512029.1 ABC transporter substrate-binding protein [Frankia nepalensis]MBL7519785.1 ABC transporter substrate-binding protein [Frankia nepalensis]MBL7628760.1 ABC transporter substrate-binding protein [Frankia nepalensis]